MTTCTPHPGARVHRVTGLVPALLAIALVGACTTHDAPPDPATPAAPQPSASPPSRPAGPPSPTPPAKVVIPTSAFVDLPAEQRKVPRVTTPVTNALPKLCGEEFGTGGRQVTASAAMTSTYQQPGAPATHVPQGTIHQSIFTFGGDGAANYLRRVGNAIEACPSYQRSGHRVTVVARPLPNTGDEALLVTETWPQTSLDGERTSGTATSQIAVVRVDEVVTVLDDDGWEGTSGSPTVMDRAVRDAVRAIEAWQR